MDIFDFKLDLFLKQKTIPPIETDLKYLLELISIFNTADIEYKKFLLKNTKSHLIKQVQNRFKELTSRLKDNELYKKNENTINNFLQEIVILNNQEEKI